MRKRPVANQAIDAIRGRGPLSHTKLYWWMWENFDVIQPTKTGRADWVTATEELSKLGFAGRKGVPLNRDNVRKTWERVVRDKAKEPKSAVAAAPLSQPPYEVPSVPRERKPLMMTPARPLMPVDAAQDDGSALPKPLGPVRK